jgi:integrase
MAFRDLADAWLAWGEVERDWKPSTRVDYRSLLRVHLLPPFGDLSVDAVSRARVERWRSELIRRDGVSRRNANKLLSTLHAIFEYGRENHGLHSNPAAGIRKLKETYDSAQFEFFSPEEVRALCRAAASEQDAAIYLTAGFAGLRRGELLALRWRDVDFANSSIRVMGSYAHGEVTLPKSGRARTVPMVDDIAHALARLGQRPLFTAPLELVFCNDVGGHLDGSALRRRYQLALKTAELRALRFHDLRHTFGSLAINKASIVQVQAWMGHADVKTTMRYLHHQSRADDARLLSDAFRTAQSPMEAALPSA